LAFAPLLFRIQFAINKFVVTEVCFEFLAVMNIQLS
jgi:hypothetical protein